MPRQRKKVKIGEISTTDTEITTREPKEEEIKQVKDFRPRKGISPKTTESRLALPDRIRDLEKRVKRAKDDLKEVKTIVWLVTGAVLIAFVIGFYMMALNNINEKEIFNDYNSKLDDYNLKINLLKDKSNEQQIQINNLENVLENLKVNYPWLKIPDF